jgi:predicted RNA-binding Zn-ribbon protein involved in translation (DUF1610 family)
MASTLVSVSRSSRSAATPRRSARSLIWLALSSPRDIQHIGMGSQMRGQLQHQRAFADARVARQQHDGPWHDATAQHLVNLADAGRDARQLAAATSVSLVGLSAASACLARPAETTPTSSSSEFQAPHCSHLPIQRCSWRRKFGRRIWK